MKRFGAVSTCTAPPCQRVIRIFPNRQSCERLLGALLMEMDEQMSCGKVYVGMDEYRTWRAARAQQSSYPRSKNEEAASNKAS